MGPLLGQDPFADSFSPAFRFPSMASHGVPLGVEVARHPIYYLDAASDFSWREIPHCNSTLGRLITDKELVRIMDSLSSSMCELGALEHKLTHTWGPTRLMALYGPQTVPGNLGYNQHAESHYESARDELHELRAQISAHVEDILELTSDPGISKNPCFRAFMDVLSERLVGRPLDDIPQQPDVAYSPATFLPSV